MKKLFFAIMAAGVMASCSSDETIDVVAGKPIAFGNPFVENSTRVITDLTYNSGNLKKFNVYGTVTGNNNTVNIYNGDEVTGDVGGATWSCSKTQYWIPDASYKFIALVDATATKTIGNETYKNEVTTDANGFPVSLTYDVRTQADLLFASHMIESATENESTVNFTFEHLLSKVMFTFINNFSENSGVKLTVEEIEIVNASQSAAYSIDGNQWSIPNNNTNATVSFGNTEEIETGGNNGKQCGNIGLLIPGQYTNLEVHFTVKHNMGNTYTSLKAIIPSILLEKGNSYNFIAELDSRNVTSVMPISFVITSDSNWDTAEDGIVDYSKDPFQ